ALVAGIHRQQLDVLVLAQHAGVAAVDHVQRQVHGISETHVLCALLAKTHHAAGQGGNVLVVGQYHFVALTVRICYFVDTPLIAGYGFGTPGIAKLAISRVVVIILVGSSERHATHGAGHLADFRHVHRHPALAFLAHAVGLAAREQQEVILVHVHAHMIVVTHADHHAGVFHLVGAGDIRQC